MKKVVSLLSGGIDSLTAMVWAKKNNYEIIGLHFNYGQLTEQKEFEKFLEQCKHFEVEKKYTINLPHYKSLRSSALTGDLPFTLPSQEEPVPSSYVPFRNATFLCYATAIAEAENCEGITIGVFAGDSPDYPDCSESFIEAFQKVIYTGTAKKNIQIFAPLLHLDKAGVIRLAKELNVPFDLTWSCYRRNDVHCGTCLSCLSRKEGFLKAQIMDTTKYLE